MLRGGSGNDTITVNDLTFAQVDGGLGTDTLHLNGTGLSLDLTSADHGVDGVEIINLTGTGNNTLTLSGAAISQHGGSNTLRVDGNAGDTATLSDYINWTNTGTTDIGAVTYNVGTLRARLPSRWQIQLVYQHQPHLTYQILMDQAASASMVRRLVIEVVGQYPVRATLTVTAMMT